MLQTRQYGAVAVDCLIFNAAALGLASDTQLIRIIESQSRRRTELRGGRKQPAPGCRRGTRTPLATFERVVVTFDYRLSPLATSNAYMCLATNLLQESSSVKSNNFHQ